MCSTSKTRPLIIVIPRVSRGNTFWKIKSPASIELYLPDILLFACFEAFAQSAIYDAIYFFLWSAASPQKLTTNPSIHDFYLSYNIVQTKPHINDGEPVLKLRHSLNSYKKY